MICHQFLKQNPNNHCLKGFVEFEDEITDMENERAMSKFVRVCEILAMQGVKFDEISFSKSIIKNDKRKTVGKKLKDILKDYPNIDINTIIEDMGVTLDYSIGNIRHEAVRAIQGKGTCPITEEEKQKLIQLGVISLEKESAMSIFVRVCEALSRQNFNFDVFKYQRTVEKGKKKALKKTLADIQKEYPNIDITKVIEETGVLIDYSIGTAKEIAVKAYQGKDHCQMTDEEKQKLIQLGVINLEKKSSMSKFVRVCEELSKQGLKFDKFRFTKQVMIGGKKKTVSKTLEDIQQEYPNIDINKVRLFIC